MRQHKEMMSPINRQLSQIKQLQTAVQANAYSTVNVDVLKKQSTFDEQMPSVGLSRGLYQPNTVAESPRNTGLSHEMISNQIALKLKAERDTLMNIIRQDRHNG